MGHLLERDDALGLLATEMKRASTGCGRLVLLRGATGTGRSALLEAAAEQAESYGLRVLSARCSPEDASSPLSTAFQLMESGPEFQGEEHAGKDRENGTQLWWKLRSTAAASPLLLAVDDVHLADAASRHWLVESARRIDQLPVLIVVTERSQYDITPAASGLTQALPPSVALVHTLAPLTRPAAAELVRAIVPAAADSWTADCVRAGAGSPLLLHALLEDVGNSPASPLPETSAALYPGAYPAAVGWWLNSAGATTAHVARALAVADRDGLWDAGPELVPLLTEASGADPARTLGWLTAMTRLGVLSEDTDGSLRYAHPLLRDAVLGDWPAELREAAGRSFAYVMLRRGDRIETVADQLLNSGPVRQPWALRALEEAAGAAARADRPLKAVRYLHRALAEPNSDAGRHRLLNRLGSLEYAYGSASAGIQRLHEALLTAAGPHDRARTAIALGTALTGRGEVPEAVGLLGEAERELTGHPVAAQGVRAAAVLLADRDQNVRAAEYRRLLEGSAGAPEAVGVAGRALQVRHAAMACELSAAEAAARLRAMLSEPADELLEPFLLATAATVTLWADSPQEAENLAERGLRQMPLTSLHPAAHMLRDVRAEVAALRGDYEPLLTDHKETAATTRRPGPTGADSYALHALTERGEFEDAWRLVRSVDLHEATDSWALSRFLHASGCLRAAEGDMTGALHDFLDSGRRLTAYGVVNPVVVPWRSAASACRLAMGDRAAARVLAQEELRLARMWNTPRTVGRALHAVAAATGGREGLALGAESVHVLRRSTDVAELVAALLSHGRQLASAGQRVQARDFYHEAARYAERVGSVRLRMAAERDLRTVGARRPSASVTGSGSLTGSERRIAELAAEGRTNTEISSFLHVARRTVESHLTSTYRKLGISGRGKLRAALGAGEETG
ncbi:AAA family ATPase [Streptomyces sp. NPDC006645]|uniref:AAA family ATPase n=1 Tax=unclassified Streptomyces TaxID=2593676 RepID=UPI00339ED0CA